MKFKTMIHDLEDLVGRKILSENYIGNLGFISQGSPYIIPITYFYDEESDTIISYSSEGHKIRAMRDHKLVSLGVSEIKSIKEWRSVLVQGTFEELKGSDAKYFLYKFAEGVKQLIGKKENKFPDFIREFSAKTTSDEIPIVYRINIAQIISKYST